MAAVALASNPLPGKLRVGLFADSGFQPRWVVEAFAKVAASDFAEIVLIATGAEGAARRPLPWPLGSKLDERLDLQRYVSVRKVPKLDLDVAFALGELDDTRLDGLARLGVWRFYADGLHEVVEGAPLSGSGLQVRLAPGAQPRLAYESWSRTEPLSIARNREQLLAKTSEFACRALRDAQRFGPGWLGQCKPARPAGERRPISANRALAAVMRNRALSLMSSMLHAEQRFLAFRHGSGAIPPDLEGFTRLAPPRDRAWLHPFPIENAGRHFVFFAERALASGKAHIAMTEVRRDGSWSKPLRVLERDYPLAYPFMLEHDGELYMVPETASNGTVELYRCVDFPLRWKLEKVLLEGARLVDATIHRGPERWWLFANAEDELHVYYAQRLLGEWQPYARNPVKSDARCARPAGRLYWRNGALYRPAQIRAPLYGAGLSINRVLRLSPQAYAERQVERVLPDCAKGILGLHTVNRAGELCVVDAVTRRRRFA